MILDMSEQTALFLMAELNIQEILWIPMVF